jgi:hypothetical protein
MDLIKQEELPPPNLEVTVEQAEAAEALDKAAVEKVHDPLAIEQQMVAEEQARLTAEPDQEEIACMMLKLYTPRFEKLVDELSNRSLRRLIKGLVEFPLGKTYNPSQKDEAQAFSIGQGLMDAKMVLVIKTYNDNKEHIIEAAAMAAATQTTVEFGDKANEATSTT